MIHKKIALPLACTLTLLTAAPLSVLATEPAAMYDLVLKNGRVMDPETGLDAVRNVAIQDGQIAAISEGTLQGKEEVNVSGLVVAPGFIDVHSHAPDAKTSEYQAHDGVTTALELEAGVYPVGDWYAGKEGRSLINYGASVGVYGTRIKVKFGEDVGHILTTEGAGKYLSDKKYSPWQYSSASPYEVEQERHLLAGEIANGSLGIGLLEGYMPGMDWTEKKMILALGKEKGVLTVAHAASTQILQEAAKAGASLHMAHVVSYAKEKTADTLKLVQDLRDSGHDVTTELYPYDASATAINSALYDAAEKNIDTYPDSYYQRLQWAATGERLTKETFLKYRKLGGIVIDHSNPEEMVQLALKTPGVLISSDAEPYHTGGEHPRAAGSFARVLGHYVREEALLPLMEALRKITLLPAQRLEATAPAFAQKGRLQVGADADITIFDASNVIDKASYGASMQFSSGIPHVIVGGTFVVRDGQTVPDVFPGEAVRAPIREGAPTRVLLDGTVQRYEQPAVVGDAQRGVLLPMRSVFESLGAELSWDGRTSTVTAVKHGKTLTIGLSTSIVTLGGHPPLTLELAPRLTGGKAMVPASLLTAFFGAKTDWDNASNTLTISTN